MTAQFFNLNSLLRKCIVIFLTLSCFASGGFKVSAQKTFTEGTLIYKIKIEVPAEHKTINGNYTFTIKNSKIKKVLKLDNGFTDIVLLNCAAGTIYSLQNKNNKKYAIELNMADVKKRQEKFEGFTVSNIERNQLSIAGYAVERAKLSYKDGTSTEVAFTKEWKPTNSIMFERFPEAKFMPMHFSYSDENGATMIFDAQEIAPGPIENAVFRIPADYKMISYQEYKELTR